MVTIESTEGHHATVRVRGLAGHIRYWLAECINVVYPGFDPPGVRMLHCPEGMRRRNRSDIVPELMRDVRGGGEALPPVYTRGPETMLKLETDDERSVWKRVSDTRFELEISKPGVFRYAHAMEADDDGIVVEGRLRNESAWDWRDAYVYICTGVDPCPALSDRTGERTFLLTAEGLQRVSDLEKRFHTDFRPAAQYYEPEGRPMARTEEGFGFDECGISWRMYCAETCRLPS